ncbi:phytochromobilin:ferredoxin oxidoreductase, chloroplastic-like [Dorcoceras hygrometricum]|uniref:Phytochromobilin:ferredoxin oxidoreductase, chloroplastic-like n=1 Tax=Dorcoceras hygrometricum TaxID=472368 RepID=A0A2Z7ANK9_9LAMI|nr:phytochromobilin:ferredoxin oxidoreductase, chloroplastic-like [Dorcoceras hygrometricum]
MEHLQSNFSTLSFISTLKKPPLQQRTASFIYTSTFAATKCSGVHGMVRPLMTGDSASPFSYKEFIHFALEETKKYTDLTPSTLQENFSCLASLDGKTQLQMLAFESPKIRLLRSLSIEGSDGMQFKGTTLEHANHVISKLIRSQVLDFAVFPRPEFDLPIFCANFFTTATTNIVVLDLNPLHDVISQKDYKEKYYKRLIPHALDYAELLPWGGKITSESLKFFSPIVIWTKFSPCQDKHHALYSAFKDYLKSWLKLMDQASGETEIPQIIINLEWQHRYLTWRAEKDPGHLLLRRLVGETLAKEIIRGFLFNGVDDMGNKTFLDYFPEYKCDDGTINPKRSMIGKSFESRPWNARGEFISNTSS